MRGFVVQDLLTLQSWRGTGIAFRSGVFAAARQNIFGSLEQSTE
jgi:hypothetical protein